MKSHIYIKWFNLSWIWMLSVVERQLAKRCFKSNEHLWHQQLLSASDTSKRDLKATERQKWNLLFKNVEGLRTYMSLCGSVWVCTRVCTYLCPCLFLWKRERVCVHVWVIYESVCKRGSYVCVCVYVIYERVWKSNCVCVYVFAYVMN